MFRYQRKNDIYNRQAEVKVDAVEIYYTPLHASGMVVYEEQCRADRVRAKKAAKRERAKKNKAAEVPSPELPPTS